MLAQSQKFLLISRRKILCFTPEIARDGSIGGVSVKVQNFYLTDKQLVINLLNIPNYVTIMGIFLKLDENLLPDNFSSTSIGMPNDNIKRNIAIPISIVDYYRVEKGFRLCHELPSATK